MLGTNATATTFLRRTSFAYYVLDMCGKRKGKKQ